MTTHPETLDYGTDLESGWKFLMSNNLKAAPMTDRFERVIGIVTLTDYFKRAVDFPDESLDGKIKRLFSKNELSAKYDVAGHIMSYPVEIVNESQHVLDLIPIFE